MSEEFTAAGNALREHLHQEALGHRLAADAAAWRAQQHRARVLQLRRRIAQLTHLSSHPAFAVRDPFDPGRVVLKRVSLAEGYALTGIAEAEARTDDVHPVSGLPWDLYQTHGARVTERIAPATGAYAEFDAVSPRQESVHPWGMYVHRTSRADPIERASPRDTARSLVALGNPAKPFGVYRERPRSRVSQQGVAHEAAP